MAKNTEMLGCVKDGYVFTDKMLINPKTLPHRIHKHTSPAQLPMCCLCCFNISSLFYLLIVGFLLGQFCFEAILSSVEHFLLFPIISSIVFYFI